MIQLLDRNMSPIVSPADFGDIYSETRIPLVVHNSGASKLVATFARTLPHGESDGYERLMFYVAETPTMLVGTTYQPPYFVNVVGGSLVGDDKFDVHVRVRSWVSGYEYSAVFLRAFCISEGAPESRSYLDTNLPVEHCQTDVYLRRIGDGQWFEAEHTINRDANNLSVSSMTACADPGVVWGTRTMSGYSEVRRTSPLPNNCPALLPGAYVPALGSIMITGGSALQNMFSRNPRFADVLISGGELT